MSGGSSQIHKDEEAGGGGREVAVLALRLLWGAGRSFARNGNENEGNTVIVEVTGVQVQFAQPPFSDTLASLVHPPSHAELLGDWLDDLLVTVHEVALRGSSRSRGRRRVKEIELPVV
jgi:hypothetical protein